MRYSLAAGLCAGLLLLAGPASAQPQPASASCAIHFYPADRLHSVGEDFDAVHKLDQDLADYDRAAGRRLDWLTLDRQNALINTTALASQLGHPGASVTISPVALKRSQALAAGPRVTPAPACLVEMSVPQLLMERGGLSARSLRLFGVVRHYQDNRLVASYAGFAVGPLGGFRLREPGDAAAATALVEQAYVVALHSLVAQSLNPRKSRR